MRIDLPDDDLGGKILRLNRYSHEALAFLVSHLELILSVAALTFAGKQFWDARGHTKTMSTLTRSMEANAGQLTKLTEEATDSLSTLAVNTSTIKESSERIKDAVSTFPPKGFIRDFCQLTTSIQAVLQASVPRRMNSTVTREDLEFIIQDLLRNVARLAKFYDSRPARYAANVMMFISRNGEIPYFPDFTEDAVRQFLREEFALDKLEGILVLVNCLSADAFSSAGPDKDVGKVIFGIPHRYQLGEKWTVLHGAPLAFVKWNKGRTSQGSLLTEAAQGIDDIDDYTRRIAEGIDGQRFEIDAEVLKKIDDYYCKSGQKQVKSLQAYPLFDSTGTAFGVLNIHCDKRIFLGEDASALEASRRHEIFASIISPIIFEISDLVKLWLEAGQKCEKDL